MTFTLGSDYDAWVFVNGNLVVDNDGIHALATAPTTVSGLLPGTNTLDAFFADRHIVQAALVFDANVTTVAELGVPETSTWAMMLAGFASLGFAAFRRSRNTGIAIA